ncbi:unnamed protein product [Brugia timori]|uniref:Transposase n=1 Tax=Brugia timori TaxID=42155 RepID=A0A0R3QMV0_9BILA|nr:unnamed protein product [Brugia timori]
MNADGSALKKKVAWIKLSTYSNNNEKIMGLEMQ